MKKQFIISALVVVFGLFSISNVSFAQGKGKGMKNCGNMNANCKMNDANGTCTSPNFVDANNDGICDNKGTGTCKSKNFVDANNDGVCDKFVDANGDGINDNCKKNSQMMGKGKKCGMGQGKGTKFVDTDGDGVCDHKNVNNSDLKINNGVSVGHQQVNFDLKEAAAVKLNVFDSNGNLVKEIYNGDLSKGPQKFEINTDGFQTGVYFYTLEYNGKVTSKQFSIVK